MERDMPRECVFTSVRALILALLLSALLAGPSDAQEPMPQPELSWEATELAPGLYMLEGVGGFTGGNMDRPALRRLLADIEAGKVDCVVVYKVDRLSRSLLDFARIMEVFDQLHSEGNTIVLVTHEDHIARRAQREIRLFDGMIASDILSVVSSRRSLASARPQAFS